MPFVRESTDKDWRADVVISGAPARMTIYGSCPSSEHGSVAGAVIRKIESEWPTIQENLLRSLHGLYNDTWADPDEGFSPLSADEFLERIKLELVDVMDEEGALSLYFDDSDLFGGHTIDLFWTADGKMHDATLAG